MDSRQLEKYSSALTLSDMEIFVFPELMHSLVLANIMSPVIWRWQEEDCFKKLEGKSSYKKLMRLKQYIMDEFEFNLDLETWGLTSQEKELARFSDFISAKKLAKSNALFGYEGDKYYFDVDIRKHFGLDKYNSDIIPYWKTETVEAMRAFRLKEGYKKGAGECVSLSALYAAAAFIVCGIPLEDIYMILTPLHSQNFIDINDGVLTNNRRLVTKAMWFNGTAISNKAQRALRNEKVTIVSHSSGFVHFMYDDATISPANYNDFGNKLALYLSADLTLFMFANFLRSHQNYQKYFQVCRDCHGHPQFIKAETLYHYEHGSDFRIADQTHGKLVDEVSEDDFFCYPLPGRIRCDELEKFIDSNKIDLSKTEDKKALIDYLLPVIPEAEELVEELSDFVYVEAMLPTGEKKYSSNEPINLSTDWQREKVVEYLQSVRDKNTTADLAFYAYRDMNLCQWEPLVKAVIERNPVSIEVTQEKSLDEVYDWLKAIADESIYDGAKMAVPDEVANYETGDGLEKAFFLANVIRQRKPEQKIEITVNNGKVVLKAEQEFCFSSEKGIEKTINIPAISEVC